MDGRKNKLVAVSAILFLCCVSALYADKSPVTIEAAEALEKAEKFDQAAAVYEEWLKEHQKDRRLAVILLRCGELKKNPHAAIELYTRYAPEISDPLTRNVVFKRIAMLHSICGNYRQALLFFEEVYVNPDVTVRDDPWLVSVVFLSIALGEYDRAYTWVEKLNPVVRKPELRAELNYALLEIYLARSETENARKAYDLIEKRFSGTNARPKAVLRFFLDAVSRKDEKAAEAYFEILKKEFSDSLEYQAALALKNGGSGNAVILRSTPHDLFAAFARDGVESTPSGAEDARVSAGKGREQVENGTMTTALENPDAPHRYRIQVGSYTMRENAVYMVKDLKRLAFEPDIVEADVNGKKYYRVFVGSSLDETDAQRLLARLNDKGIGGYLSPDQ